ncbi:MAG: hypothetical protein HXX09_01180 [Bacteroidetes bacterium]|nr:hypothetical protein [Bacteroidota bacterium]
MKKLFALLLVAGMTSFIACGPSAADKAKVQATKDSLAKDSIAKVEAAAKLADSLANVAKIEAAKADSIAKAGEKKTKGTVKPKGNDKPKGDTPKKPNGKG